MLIPGEYEYKDQHGAGRVVLRVKETPQAFSLTLIENTIRYEAPQIDDLFSHGEKRRYHVSTSKSFFGLVAI